MIKQEGKKYVLYSKDGSKKLGEHDSEEDAKKQEAAIEISKHRSAEDQETYFRSLLSGVDLKALAPMPDKSEISGDDKEAHPFTYCMTHVIPAIEREKGAVDDPESFCGWWKGEQQFEAAAAKPVATEPVSRQVHLMGATGTIRTATYESREHMVVPVVALMEGVIHAINADTPEYVPLTCLAVAPQGWNGRPVVLGHPVKNGHQISANSPEVLEAQGFGRIFNARLEGKKLMLEAWIDPTKAEAVGAGEMLNKLRAQRMCEVSVGAFVVTDSTPGMFGDKSYKAVWRDVVPDHLAFLPKGLGACSNEMGCGAPRAAAAHLVTADGLELVTPAAAAQTGPGTVPAMPGRTARPRTAQPGDTPSQAASEEKAELIAYQTLRTLLDQLSESWDASSEIVDDLISDETENPTQTVSDEEAETEVERARVESLQVLCMSMYSTLNAFMNLTTDLLRPEPMQDVASAPRYMQGARHSASDRQIIQRVHDHAVSLGAECSGMKAAEAPRDHQPTEQPVTAPAEATPMACSCGGSGKPATSGGKMTPEKRTETIKTLIEDKHSGFVAADEKMLTAASDERLEAFRVAAQARAKEVEEKTPVKETPAAETPAVTALETKPMSEADFMKAAPESLRALISRAQAQETARKTQLVTTLKTAQAEYSESELAAMSLDALERFGRAVGVKAAEVETTSYAGRALPRAAAAAEKDVFTNPPDPYADGLKALRAKDGYAPVEPVAQ